MKLSVIIVNYNVEHYLEQCLCSVRQAINGLEADVWVVDNASTDESMAHLPVKFPDVHFVANTENVGFSRANNIGIRASEGEYVLLLNPDTVVGEEVLKDCIRFLDAHPEVGATGVAMLKADGGFAWESRRGLPTPFTSFCKMSGLCALFPKSRRFGRYYMRYLDRTIPNEIEVISGAFNMLRREALNKVGLLDEDFFMYGEDVDLSFRLLQHGYKNYYLPHRILHYKGESTQKTSLRYVHIFYEAMLIFFDKHYGRKYRFFSALIRLAVVLRALVDVCLQQYEKVKNLFRSVQKVEDTDRYLVLCGAETMPKAKELCAKHGLYADFVEATEQTCSRGHLSMLSKAKQYNVVVYDVDSYRYATILDLMAEGEKEMSISLGTYSARTQKLITINDVFA